MTFLAAIFKMTFLAAIFKRRPPTANMRKNRSTSCVTR
jgi:hypothetical protein